MVRIFTLGLHICLGNGGTEGYGGSVERNGGTTAQGRNYRFYRPQSDEADGRRGRSWVEARKRSGEPERRLERGRTKWRWQEGVQCQRRLVRALRGFGPPAPGLDLSPISRLD